MPQNIETLFMQSDSTFQTLYLGARLQSIFDIVESVQHSNRYDSIWDCCCDHGYLGINILNANISGKLYFVDQVPHIIKRLVPKLEQYPADKYDLFSADAGELKFSSQQRHLVILAGISGKTIIKVLQTIKQNHPDGDIDFILCPTNAIYNVRDYLNQQPLSLLDEILVTEKNRHYEVIYVSSLVGSSVGDGAEGKAVSLTGAMWDGDNQIHQGYLHKLIKHFEREAQGDDRQRSKDILKEYQATYNKLYSAAELV